MKVGRSLHRRVWGRTMGDFACPNIHCAPTSGGILSKAQYEHVSTWPACAVLTELNDQEGVKAIADSAGLPSTSEETKVLDPHMPPEVLNFKPSHGSLHTMLLNTDGVLLLFCGRLNPTWFQTTTNQAYSSHTVNNSQLHNVHTQAISSYSTQHEPGLHAGFQT